MPTAFPKTFMSFFSLVFSILLATLSVFQAPTAKVGVDMPTTPDDFVPAIRMIVCSDTHSKSARVADMIETSYSLFENDKTYPGIDVFAFCGDYTVSGGDKEQDEFKAVLDEHIREGTIPFIILGNHELNNNAGSREYFTKIFGKDPEQHITVNGFHLIGISNFVDEKFPREAVNWAKAELKSAKKATPDLPIFTFQHPHNFATVYGSVHWGTPRLNGVWTGSPQVVNFSGHSHYPINDPRSVWQGSYTAFGCGGLKYLELENELEAGNYPEDAEEIGQFYVVEADRDGSVRVRPYDLVSDTFFGGDYYIDDVKRTSDYTYTYKNRMAYNTKPEFADDAEGEIVKNEDGTFTVSFDKATDMLAVHDYKIVISAFGFPAYSESFLSDYYLVNDKTTLSYNIGTPKFVDGVKYTVSITAANAYYELSSPLTFTFKADNL